MTINITNHPGGIVQPTDKPIINIFGRNEAEATHITQGIMSEANMPDAGRLALFDIDKVKLAELIRNLGVCCDTADVKLAVAKLAIGKVLPSFCKEKSFAAAILPFLKFETTESAIYQALKNISL